MQHCIMYFFLLIYSINLICVVDFYYRLTNKFNKQFSKKI